MEVWRKGEEIDASVVTKPADQLPRGASGRESPTVAPWSVECSAQLHYRNGHSMMAVASLSRAAINPTRAASIPTMAVTSFTKAVIDANADAFATALQPMMLGPEASIGTPPNESVTMHSFDREKLKNSPSIARIFQLQMEITK